MPRYKDVEGYRKLFDEEYKKTRQLISEGETHLDNLAEGFSEASRVIDRMPTADVAPKSEVAREIFAEIEKKIKTSITNFLVEINMEHIQDKLLYDRCSGAVFALRNVEDFLAELKKKYIGEKK